VIDEGGGHRGRLDKKGKRLYEREHRLKEGAEGKRTGKGGGSWWKRTVG